MFGASAWLLVATGALLAAAIAVFGWALFSGRLDVSEDAAAVILDPRDLRIARPWETEQQLAERVQEHGPLLEPERSEWGGW